MKLVPVQGVLAAVRKAEQSSPEGADALVRFGLFEAMSDLTETHRGQIEPLMLVDMEKRLAGARSRLLRTAVGKSLEGQDIDVSQAEHLAVLQEWVSKSLSGALLALFNREHPRDAKGRFVTAEVSGSSPGSPAAERENSTKLEANRQVGRWVKSGLINPDTPVSIHYRQQDDKGKTGEQLERLHGVTQADLNERLAGIPGAEVASISVDRRRLNPIKRGDQNAVDLMRTFTSMDEQTARRLGEAVPTGPNWGANAAQRWYGASNGTDRKGYRQLAMTGEALRRVSVPGSDAHSVGTVAQLMGEMGPEAEKILGPGIRRTAYRYRGTERRPDRDLVVQVRDAVALANDQKPRDHAGGAAYAHAANNLWHGLEGDQRELRTVGDTAVAYFLGAGGGGSHLPSRELTELSLESGEVPPSEGVLIDAHGRVHSQAVGYNGDHYLPFDLKNLNALFGGQYVRTRAAGGPSTEDLYTGLLAGARQIQVVSNSGVFTLEFDPDLRGGRRYSDKAKRMVQRYGELLDAIASQKLYQTDLSPEKKAELRRQAAVPGSTEAEYEQNLDTLMSRARMQGSLQDTDDDEIETQVEEYARNHVAAEERRAGRLGRQQIAERLDHYRQEGRKQLGGAEVRRLRLDGPGYDRALKALKQEFPYYIRTAEWQSLPDWVVQHGLQREIRGVKYHAPADRGRVETGQTNPYLPGHTEESRSLAQRRHNQYARLHTRGGADVSQTPAAAGGAEGGSTVKAPAAAATTAVAAPSPAQVMEAMKKPGSAYVNAVHEAARESVHLFKDLDPPNGMPPTPADEDAQRAMNPTDFTAWKFRVGMGSNEAKFAHWLVNAQEWEQEKVLDSLQGAQAANRGFEDQTGYDDARLARGYKALSDLINLSHPFAPKAAEGDPEADYTDAPDYDDPRPMALADFPVGKDPEWYAAAEAKLAINEPETVKALADIASQDDEHVAVNLTRKVESYGMTSDPERKKSLRRELEAINRAWTFRTARDASKRMAALGLGGGAGPKAPPDQVGKSGPRPRRVLMFHVPSGASVVKSRRTPVSR